MKIKESNTPRGFKLFEFTDRYGANCSIQESSLATEGAIWFGIDNPEPKILSSKAKQYGIETNETTGWVPFPIPDEVLINTRMHLTVDQVKALLPILQNFIDNDGL